jgi:D-aminopeptidase
VVGYEGNEAMGYLPADNGIYWIGDAGISASLDDMLAWECFIDATRDDPQGVYNRLSAQPTFADGTAASYGFGLKHDVVAGRKTTGHGGALRGFRAQRLHVGDERLSVVVMFNHEADAHAAAYGLVETALGHQPAAGLAPSPDWRGLWLDEAQGLVLRTEPDETGIALHYATTKARLTVGADGVARGGGVSLARGAAGLTMLRPAEALTVTPRPVGPVAQADATDLAGRYWSDELEAHLTITTHDGGTYAGFEGMLGAGPMEAVYSVADDLSVIPTRRSMDASPPGDWTVQVRREASGQISGLTLGCWLARRIDYRRV